MKTQGTITRRVLVRSATFGILTASIPNILYARSMQPHAHQRDLDLSNRYPSIDDALVEEVVGASHFNFDRVKELVTYRPELARANWDWAFGDWESALGAACHVGRRDIAEFLISHGARPNLFTFAMMGDYASVKSMITGMPGIQQIQGPHGISLLQHARAGARWKALTREQKAKSEQLIDYLMELGDADLRPTDIEMSLDDKQKYLGDYKYGQGPAEGFTVQLNMRKMLSLGRLGQFGGGLYQKAPNVFTYNGVSSVEISFEIKGENVSSVTVTEPDLVLKAEKV